MPLMGHSRGGPRGSLAWLARYASWFSLGVEFIDSYQKIAVLSIDSYQEIAVLSKDAIKR